MKIETKLSVGDMAFFMYKNRIMASKIERITIEIVSSVCVLYVTGCGTMEESNVFKSKEDVITSLRLQSVI